MKLECILELMKEKEHIKFYAIGNDNMPMIYKIKNLRGRKLGQAIFDIFKLQKYQNEYICNFKTYSEILFAKKEDVDKWVKENINKEETIIKWESNHLDSKLKDYLENNHSIIMTDSFGKRLFINKTIEAERIKKEKEQEQEALDLLKQIL